MMTPARPMHGLWIDDAPRLVTTPDYWSRFVDLGFTTAAVMLETMSAGFDPKFDRAHIERVGELCRKVDVELVLTIWPEPRAAYLAQMVELLPPFLKVSGTAALEFDTESNWTPRRLQGFRSMEEASDALMKVIRKFAELDIRIELTTFPLHQENSRNAALAGDVDRIVPQAYSVRNRSEGKIPWTHSYGPGGMQRLTLDRALQIPRRANGKPRLSCGLAAYDQTWPGKTAEEAMRVAYEEALRYEPVEVRWWSSKWVLGARKLSYTERFFKELAMLR